MSNLFYDKEEGFYFQDGEEIIYAKIAFNSADPNLFIEHQFEDVYKAIINVLFDSLIQFKNYTKKLV